MEKKEDIYEVDTLFRKIVIESRTLDIDLEELVMNNKWFNETNTPKEDEAKEKSDLASKKRSSN